MTIRQKEMRLADSITLLASDIATGHIARFNLEKTLNPGEKIQSLSLKVMIEPWLDIQNVPAAICGVYRKIEKQHLEAIKSEECPTREKEIQKISIAWRSVYREAINLGLDEVRTLEAQKKGLFHAFTASFSIKLTTNTRTIAASAESRLPKKTK